MIRIIILCDFWKPRDAAAIFKDVFQKGIKNYQHAIEFVDRDYTHAIILNTYMPLLSIPKENIIGFAWEPLEFLQMSTKWLDYVRHHIGTYFIGRLLPQFPPNIKLGYPYMCHGRQRDDYFNHMMSPKTKTCCIIFSQKCILPGHQYRFQMIQKILSSDLPIDIYGRGCALLNHMNDSRIKGEFDNIQTVCNDYKYMISIENTKSDSYISEKFIDCIYLNMIPIYWGGNVEQYFGDHCLFRLNGCLEEDFKQIKYILEHNLDLDLSLARKELFTGKAYLMKFLYNLFKN